MAWGLLFVTLHQVFVLLSVRLASRNVDLWYFFSSDTLQYQLMYRDLFELGFHYAGWNVSHSPEYVQMLWTLLLRACVHSTAAGHVLEAMTQPVLLALALQFLLSRVRGPGTLLGPVAVTTILMLITRDWGLDLIAFIWSNRHGFTALIAVVGLTCLVDTLCSKGRPVLLGLVVGVGVASDLIFLVWFVVPAALVVISLGVSGLGRARMRRALVALLGGTLLGMSAFWLATPTITVGSKVTIRLGDAAAALSTMLNDARRASATRTAFNALLIAGPVLAALSAWRSRRIEVRALGLFAACMLVITVAALAMTGAPLREAGYTRYLVGPLLAALTMLVVATADALGRHGEKLLLVALAALIFSGFRTMPEGVTPVSQYDPPLVRCIDRVARKHGLEYGVADYWLAKYVTAFSSVGLSVVPVTARLDPFVSFTNVEWFLGGVGARHHDHPVYTFAILGSQTPEEPGVAPQALAALGRPVAVESCYGYRIEVLPRGSSRRIRAQFAQSPAIRDYYAGRGVPLPKP